MEKNRMETTFPFWHNKDKHAFSLTILFKGRVGYPTKMWKEIQLSRKGNIYCCKIKSHMSITWCFLGDRIFEKVVINRNRNPVNNTCSNQGFRCFRKHLMPNYEIRILKDGHFRPQMSWISARPKSRFVTYDKLQNNRFEAIPDIPTGYLVKLSIGL